MFFEWSDKYLLNVPQIDSDHKNLFAIANRLHDYVSVGQHDRTIAQALNHLVKYVHEHFDREERLMDRFAFPGVVEHRKYHRLLEQIVSSMQKVYRHEPEAVDTGKLMEFLRDWLEQHILGADQLYEPWVTGKLATGGDGLYAIDAGRMDSDPKDESVNVIVPDNKVWVVQECARLLREQHWRATSIEHAALEGRAVNQQKVPGPDKALNLDKAKMLAKDVLR